MNNEGTYLTDSVKSTFFYYPILNRMRNRITFNAHAAGRCQEEGEQYKSDSWHWQAWCFAAQTCMPGAIPDSCIKTLFASSWRFQDVWKFWLKRMALATMSERAKLCQSGLANTGQMSSIQPVSHSCLLEQLTVYYPTSNACRLYQRVTLKTIEIPSVNLSIN
jgi:hypothetical protein